MLFNSDTPSLLGYTRLLIPDPSGEPQTMFTDGDLKSIINQAYGELYAIGREKHVGIARKRTYFTTTTSIFYSLPTDFVHMVMVEVSGDGNNLSTGSPSTWNLTVLEEEDATVALRDYNEGGLTKTRYWFQHGQNFGIVSPLATTGTNSGRLTYEAETTALSADTDEPVMTSDYHELIAYKAAIVCREINSLDAAGLWNIYLQRLQQYKENVGDRSDDPDDTIPVAGLQQASDLTIKAGKIIHS